jgi:hypothetical protein
MNLTPELFRDALDVGQACGSGWMNRGHVLRRLDCKGQRSERLPDLIMEISRRPSLLILASICEPSQKIGSRGFSLDAFRDLRSERTIGRSQLCGSFDDAFFEMRASDFELLPALFGFLAKHFDAFALMHQVGHIDSH